MNALGIGGLGSRDESCAVIRGGSLAAALEVQKLSGGELDDLVRETLQIAGLPASAIDCVGVARSAYSTSLDEIRELFPETPIRLVDHHFAHAASAFFASGYDQATVLTLDSGDEFTTAELWDAGGGQLHSRRQMLLPDSVGLLYSRVTELLGFDARADEHKVQWLSPAGDGRFTALFQSILGEPWGRMDSAYLRRTGFSSQFFRAIGLEPGAEIPEPLRAHLAAGVQRAMESYVREMIPPGGNLCLAGGVFFNVLLVLALESSGLWPSIFVQPAAGNSGTGLGAAYAVSSDPCRPLETLALGPEYAPEAIKQVLENCKLRFRYALTGDELVEAAIRLLLDNKIVAWMQGRMEFGPRALGQRSILASPLDPFASENLNVYIKHREGFRKFAAAVPSERAAEFFEVSGNSRFLATVGRVRESCREKFQNSILGADLARVHTVDRESNPLFHRLLTDFGNASGLPVLYNTSFNLFGDPLVCTPRDAIRSFYSSGIDALVAGHFVVEK
jgi:carbamoyltransferase